MLKNTVTMSLLLAAVIVISGCQDSVESVMEDALACTEEVLDILKGVKDKATAEAALSDLEDLKGDMEAVKKRMEAITEDMKDASQEEQMEMLAEMMTFAEKGMAAEKAISAEKRRLQGIPGAEKVLKLVAELDMD